MKYFRSYPYIIQLLLLLSVVLTISSAATFFILLTFSKVTGLSVLQLSDVSTSKSPVIVIGIELVMGATNLFTFCVPALLYAYFATPHKAGYLGMRKPGKPMHYLLAILIMLGIAPVLNLIQALVGLINFGPGVKAAQKVNDEMMAGIMNISSAGAFLRVFCLFAVIPGIGEELLFRGLLLRFARKRSNNMTIPILFSAAVFAAVHGDLYGLPSIFAAGVVLAVIYNLTGSIWCSILGHIAFNSLSICCSFMENNNPHFKSLINSGAGFYAMVGIGTLIAAIAFYALWKNRTPLPPDWTDDFTHAELSQIP